MAAIVAGGVLLSWPEARGGSLAGPLLAAGACVAWAVDNNLTRRVSGGDAAAITCLKGMVAESVNVVLAWQLGATVSSSQGLAAAAVVGFLGYGVSLVLFIVALRHLGTARTGAYFSVAPFFGAAALVLLDERATMLFLHRRGADGARRVAAPYRAT